MVDLIPRSVLFGNPERTSPEISPDGGSLAWIAPRDGVLNLWVAPAGGESGVDWAAARPVTEDTDRGIRAFAWARDGRHVLYVQDVGGDENWRLYDVDPRTLERRDLTPFEGIHATIIGTSKRRPDEVLVGINADNPQLHDVYRLHLASGELVKEIVNPGYAGWLADEDLQVRCAIAPLPDGSFNVLVRDSGEGEFRYLLAIPAEDATSTDVVSFSGDGRSLLMISAAGSDTGRLIRVDLATGDATVLAEDPEADVTGVLLHPDTRDPLIVSVLKDRMTYVVLDPSVADDLKAVRALHPGDPSVSGRDEADTTWLIAFNVDAGLGHLLHVRPRQQDRAAAVRGAARPVRLRAGGHGAVLVPGTGRPGRPRLRHLPARPRPGEPARRARRARGAADPGRLGVQPGSAVARQPRLPVRPGELPGFHRLREGIRRRGGPRVGRQDARRPG